MTSPAKSINSIALNPRIGNKETSFSSPKKITELTPQATVNGIDNKYPGFSRVAVEDLDGEDKASEADSDDSIAIDLDIDVDVEEEEEIVLPVAVVKESNEFDKKDPNGTAALNRSEEKNETKELNAKLSNGTSKNSPKATIVREKNRAVSGRDTPGN
jgi:hypothetical protein